MTKVKSANPEAKTAASKASFQWDSNADQTYGPGEPPILIGFPANFNKTVGYEFIMDAPGQTLSIEPTTALSGGVTIWGEDLEGTTTNKPSVFDIRNGTFSFAVNEPNTLALAESGSGTDGLNGTKFTVRNNAKFVVQGSGLVWAAQNLMLRIQDSGSVAMAAGTINFDCFDADAASVVLVDRAQMSLSGGFIWIKTPPVTLADNAQMSIVANSIQFGATGNVNGQFGVASSPDTSTGGAYSFDSTSATTTGIVEQVMDFSANSRSRIRGPVLETQNSDITARDSALLHMQFDEYKILGHDVLGVMRFVLGADRATFQLDGYSVDNPFDFIHKTYPAGLFELRTGTAAPDSSEFVIKDPNAAFGLAAMINQRLIAIDGERLADSSRLDVTYDAQGYTHIKLKK